MLLDRYEYHFDQLHKRYEFYSCGPNGIIHKAIVFTALHIGEKIYYNLGFGDWNEETQDINDFAISNNADRKKILATVAASVIDFTNHNKRHKILAIGSTTSRTRLYQMSIASYIDEINDLFIVEGLLEDTGWEFFKKGRNYSAFLVTRR